MPFPRPGQALKPQRSLAADNGLPVPAFWSRHFFAAALYLVIGLASGAETRAEDLVRVAVAANFKPVMDELGALRSRTRPVKLVVTVGASGLLYAQIREGAPFDLFFSADRERPEQLERDGLSIPGSRFTYAIGKLVLWTPGQPVAGDPGTVLRAQRIRIVAIANPAAAPYGAAAEQVLKRLGLQRAAFRVVRGESVGQTFQFLATGNADAGFIARSQLREYERANGRSLAGETLAIDPALHSPIAQDVVLLKSGAGNPAAQEFLEFIRSEEARRLIRAAGYDLP